LSPGCPGPLHQPWFAGGRPPAPGTRSSADKGCPVPNSPVRRSRRASINPRSGGRSLPGEGFEGCHWSGLCLNQTSRPVERVAGGPRGGRLSHAQCPPSPPPVPNLSESASASFVRNSSHDRPRSASRRVLLPDLRARDHRASNAAGRNDPGTQKRSRVPRRAVRQEAHGRRRPGWRPGSGAVRTAEEQPGRPTCARYRELVVQGDVPKRAGYSVEVKTPSGTVMRGRVARPR